LIRSTTLRRDAVLQDQDLDLEHCYYAYSQPPLSWYRRRGRGRRRKGRSKGRSLRKK
jgi:hypothetical protein